MHIIWLVLLFETKHFIADWLLQTDYMFGKFKRHGWILPLSAHCGVHALFTLAICLLIRPELFWLAGVDFVIHFLMDRFKASPNLLGRYKLMSDRELATASETEKRHNKIFWKTLGLDQWVHSLTNLLIVAALVFL